MALMKRARPDVEWPEWLPLQRWFEGSGAWPDLFGEGSMRVEEYEDEGELVIRAEMAGIDPDEDVEITVSDHRLCIKAERREKSESEDKKGFRSEFRYGSFVKNIPLPAGATEDDVRASYEDGILEVRVPVDSEEVEAKKIPVSRG